MSASDRGSFWRANEPARFHRAKKRRAGARKCAPLGRDGELGTETGTATGAGTGDGEGE